MMKLKPLVKMMAVVSIANLPATTALYASDLSLYKGNTTGKTSILLMLDTSGSMGISSLVLPKNNTYGSPGDVDSSLCSQTGIVETGSSTAINQWAYNAIDRRAGSNTLNKTSFKKQVTINGKIIYYYLRGCGNPSIDASGKLIESSTGKFDRISRLKDALIQLLADASISDDIYMGLGNFSSRTPLTIGTTTNKLVDGHSGRILVPAAKLTAAQREKLILQLVSLKSVDTTTNEDGSPNANLKLSSTNYPDIFKASSGTPTAHAYAEAAAYMMGATTGQDPNPVTNTSILYDGYSVMQNSSDASKQVYYVCVALGNENPEALGAKVMACDNEWNKGDGEWYDSANKRMGSGIKIYRPKEAADSDPDGDGWIPVTANELHAKVGDMNSLWETHSKLRIGWRYGGWMRLANEPMDIEPIGGKVWGNKGAWNLVSYRSSPFSIRSNTIVGTAATCKQTTSAVNRPFNTKNNGNWLSWKNCPSGYSPISSWQSLCTKSGSWSRDATSAEINAGRCLEPADGSIDPLPDARDPSGNRKNDEHYNLANTNYTASTVTTAPVDNNYGGFAYSAHDTKSGSNYIAGGFTSSCDGNGIYMLTDGAPNSTKDTMARTIMNKSLNDNTSYTFTAMPSGEVLVSPVLTSGLFTGETGGWEYIGEYSKKLLDKAENPANMSIKTAVVGFGASFAGIPKNGDGSYDCEVVKDTNKDAYNACKWGGADYGNGGFYYADSSDEIKDSIIKFVNNVTVSMTPSSLGSISVPRDPLDQTQVMATGFFPMIMPLDGSTFVTWAGNLKKYKILGGTLKDNSNNAVYKNENNQQIINSSAKDLWSIVDGVDHSLVSSGGVWNKIPTPSALNIIGEPSKFDSIRNIFAMDGSTLKRVTKENLATDYSGTTPPTLDLVNIGVTKRYNLLNYLGYKAVATTTLSTTQINALSATTPSSPYRYLGGVVHSTPLVVTDSVTLNSSGNNVGSRKEYVVYGSMEGGLHIVDASTGEEKSVFVPKEVLDNQDGKSLANFEFKETGTLSYGVDAPWAADNTFKVVSSTSNGVTTTKYQATRMNIYGGLRMGGSALYGLNISSPTSPSLLFQITPSTAGFSRMGQIWSKPTIADIRVKGERKRVLIFGGGYDASVYEKDATAFTEPTSATLGNAIYVVDASNGTLLWMASSDTTGIASHKNRASSEMLYSVTGQPVVRDYDADGLADMIYFGDLGGQIFRVDLNNATQVSKTTDVNLGVRVKRLANLRTGSGSSSFVPRFYERLTTAVFGNAANRFVLVTAGSGNRSFPLEGSNQKNKIYGILDYDAATKGIENSGYVASNFKAVATNDNLINRGVLGKTSTNISNWGASGSINDDKAVAAMGPTGTYRGWSFDLRSVGDESAKFYAKSFEESQLISNDLYVNLYDSKAVLGGGTGNACGGGVQGLSTTHRICAPYANCAAYVKQDYQGVLGPILGLSTEGSRTSGLVGSIVATQEACVGQCPSSNTALTDQNLFNYSQSRKIKPTKWYER